MRPEKIVTLLFLVFILSFFGRAVIHPESSESKGLEKIRNCDQIQDLEKQKKCRQKVLKYMWKKVYNPKAKKEMIRHNPLNF